MTKQSLCWSPDKAQAILEDTEWPYGIVYFRNTNDVKDITNVGLAPVIEDMEENSPICVQTMCQPRTSSIIILFLSTEKSFFFFMLTLRGIWLNYQVLKIRQFKENSLISRYWQRNELIIIIFWMCVMCSPFTCIYLISYIWIWVINQQLQTILSSWSILL